MTNPARSGWWILLAVLVATVVAYLPGFPGDFALDDDVNLRVLQRWLSSELTWQGVVFTNASGDLGRPVAMASFLANAAFTGMAPGPMKATNLVLHLLCGALAFLIARAALRRGRESATKADTIALVVAAVWLLLPLHTSTVLYAIQRMTQLSSLFVLLGLWAYLAWRARAVVSGRARALLALAVATTTTLAAFSKENGVLLLPMIAAAEWALFDPGNTTTERRFRRVVLTLGALLPLVLGTVVLVAFRDRWMEGYLLRDFDLGDRLLTQGRVLWDYVRAIVLPSGPELGLFHDDYPVSRGWWTPPSTLLAWAAWGVLALSLPWLRRRGLRLAALGFAWFAIGHAIESSVFPLEIKFEHRNYLPALGLLLALADLLVAAWGRLRAPSPEFRRLAFAGVVGLVVMYGVATWARAGVWASTPLIYTEGLRHHPDSPRLRFGFAFEAALGGRLADAEPHLEVLSRVAPSERSTAALIRILANCVARAPTDPAEVRLGVESAPARVSTYGIGVYQALAQRIESGTCTHGEAPQVIEIGEAWLQRSTLPPRRANVWLLRYWVARLQVATGQFDAALAHAERAWADSGHSLNHGLLVFQLHATRGDLARASEVLDRLRSVDRGWDLLARRSLEAFEAHLEAQAR